MTNSNPESKFVTKDLSAYNGMKLEEYTFCQLEDYNGIMQNYKLDVITSPEDPEAPRPVVIFIHGGGFIKPNDRRQGYIPTFARALTKAGYAVVSPDYPVFDSGAQRATWNKTLGADRAAEAVHLAYLYIKENAEKFNFDTERIAVMGGSAGGWTAFYLLEHYDDKFRFFGNCWGSPRNYLPDVTKFPPTVSVHGTADKLVSYDLELPIHAAFEKAGIPNKLITLEDAPHTPMKYFETYIPTVLEWLEKYMRD